METGDQFYNSFARKIVKDDRPSILAEMNYILTNPHRKSETSRLLYFEEIDPDGGHYMPSNLDFEIYASPHDYGEFISRACTHKSARTFISEEEIAEAREHVVTRHKGR